MMLAMKNPLYEMPTERLACAKQSLKKKRADNTNIRLDKISEAQIKSLADF